MNNHDWKAESHQTEDALNQKHWKGRTFTLCLFHLSLVRLKFTVEETGWWVSNKLTTHTRTHAHTHNLWICSFTRVIKQHGELATRMSDSKNRSSDSISLNHLVQNSAWGLTMLHKRSDSVLPNLVTLINLIQVFIFLCWEHMKILLYLKRINY